MTHVDRNKAVKDKTEPPIHVEHLALMILMFVLSGTRAVISSLILTNPGKIKTLLILYITFHNRIV